MFLFRKRGPWVQKLHLSHRFSTKSAQIIDDFFAAGPTWSLRELSSPNTSSTESSINNDQLEKLAELSHLNIPLDQRAGVIEDVQAVLGMVSLVQEGAQSWTHDHHSVIPIVASTKLREDTITVNDLSDLLLKNASKSESGYFVVPNTQGTVEENSDWKGVALSHPSGV